MAATPGVGQVNVTLCGATAPPPSASVCGFSVIGGATGPQIALQGKSGFLVSLERGEEVCVKLPVTGIEGPCTVTAEILPVKGEAEVILAAEDGNEQKVDLKQSAVELKLLAQGGASQYTVRLITRGKSAGAAAQWRRISLRTPTRLRTIDQLGGFPWPDSVPEGSGPPPVLPALRPSIEQALIEWDWRMQDGIGTERNPSTYAAAIERALQRGDKLVRDLRANGQNLEPESRQWEALRKEWNDLNAAATADELRWERLWRKVHVICRKIALGNPLANVGPLIFVKRVPSHFSHQLTQYYGSCAKPGGGLFVLDAPGESMQCREVTAGMFPAGSFLHPEVSFDGKRLLFAYCHAETAPPNREAHLDRFYHLYEINIDGGGLRQLTDGPFDDFSPHFLPNGQILFVSTRRGGFHRCGRGPCPTYTLAIADGDGSNAHPVSYHETHEWDPCVLNDGRVVYTRWDYVDRHAVHYEQLWTVRADGSNPQAYYGNNTLNPVGVWEARPVPGSKKVMATAAAHHAMTAGSIILLDVNRGIDGLAPITRLTPDALFPESEEPVSNGGGGNWHAPAGVTTPPPVPPEAERWPGHCYRTPYPLSEKYFLAAYSFDSLIGEPASNPPNMFGIYLVDCFGNKELLHRDPNISSLWPIPVRPRERPPEVPPAVEPTEQADGTFFLSDVHASWPSLPKGSISRLRIVQVLPKSTPHINAPSVGVPNASPGRQVLGTVPVEPDGSAYFRAPAGIPLAFQALDERGQAVQIMRSITYLQPGETVSCVGCHERRSQAPKPKPTAQALERPPSTIEPGPEGSRPFSYPILVQPILDKHCVSCHSGQDPDGGVLLTGEPQGHYTVSYNALVPRVRYSAWGVPGDFRRANSEPMTKPGFFGARGSPLMKLLLDGHENAVLNEAELERMAIWMDTNALFYGTFDQADQARQQRGERIESASLQ